MLRLEQTGKIGGDCTAPYTVILDKSYTVKEFVIEVLKDRSEWGYIGIEKKGEIFEKPYCEYRYGKLLSKLPHNILNRRVISARAHGGWSRMDYKLNINEEQKNDRK